MNKCWTVLFLTIILCLPGWLYSQTNNAVLTVNLYPAEIQGLGAGWQLSGMDEKEWYPSGKTLILSGGSYTIKFKIGIKGWKAPADKQVIMENGKTVEIAGVYERLKGSLKVSLFPTKAIEDGAQWRRVGQETWLNSDVVEEKIPSGKYIIEFKKINGWKKPADVEIDLRENIVNSEVGQYDPLGSLIVNITPAEAVKAGAMWKLSKESVYRKSGEKIEELDLGEYTIEFKDVSGWTKPEPIKVNLTDNATKTISGVYKLVSTSEGTTEGTAEGEGEENKSSSSCGCNKNKEWNDLKKLLNDFFFIGICVGFLGLWRGSTKNRSAKK